ncbi:MAG: redox-sensitive transcriptional activator SoxR [Chromatiales bacterium]|jgi:MerR family transcriptional regulator, redox-sensitive transcriptional activator SoxR|nr:redox-sensitive transcriptional activator SoxR [Chromatiales bacterium]
MAKSSKDYLTIGQMAERAGVSSSALRFYETRGLIQSVRNVGNQRRYHRSVLRRLSIIQVAKDLGLTLEEIGNALGTLPQDRVPTKRDWQRLSGAWKERLDARISQLERMRDRLTGCIGCGCLSLRTCALFNNDDEASSYGAGPRYLLGDNPRPRSKADYSPPATKV